MVGPKMRILIVGCGYVGLALGQRLSSSGAEVLGLRRQGDPDGAMAAAGIQPLSGDLTRPADLEAIPGDFDAVVCAVSSSRGGADAYREVYLGGARNLIEWARHRRVGRMVSVSSTSVYSQTDGSWVSEDSPVEPAGETGRLLVRFSPRRTERASLPHKSSAWRASMVQGAGTSSSSSSPVRPDANKAKARIMAAGST
jgi:nucleoside-diphosphate-sugar epimerase